MYISNRSGQVPSKSHKIKELHMYARTVKLHLKPNSVSEFTRTFEKDILPLLQKQDGFKDEITFVAEHGRDAVAISLWDSKESADQYTRDTYPQVLKGLTRLVEGTPEVQAYGVGNSTFHEIASQG
jgi:heme-degrading monooxygenase HmoA